MWKTRLAALLVLALGAGVGYFDYTSQNSSKSWLQYPFKLGLDLSGGTHLVYEADTSDIPDTDISEALASLRGVIERRVNLFGVTEPVVQLEGGGLAGEGTPRLIVELPGVSDIDAAVALIDKTPNLEFQLARTVEGTTTPEFVATGLSGRYLTRAQVVFAETSVSPAVAVEFNEAGSELFATITREHVGEPLAIFLDGELISIPVIREEIRDGRAEISGQFTLDDAKQLTRDLNLGALPVPIKLVSSQTIGATLGEDAVTKGATAGLYGLLAIMAFLILWYRVPGLLASVALAIYVALSLALFKLVPVTLTSAGIAGFILSLGIAVDANVLIFERMKEELASGKELRDAIEDGFSRAWLSIRDSNVSSIVTALILFWFGESLIEGFALTFMFGVLISMFSAIVITRVLLRAVGVHHTNRITRFLFGSGLR